MRFLLMALCAAPAAGCGYSVGGLIEHRSVFVPIFGSQSERRGHEFELHKAILRDLQGQGVDVNDPQASLEMRGRILDITEPSLVEDEADRPVVGAVAFRVEIILVSRPDGREISKRVFEESASFATPRFESRDTARQAVIDRIARRVASMLEKEL